MAKQPNWSSKEDNLLKVLYPYHSAEELQKYLPNRSLSGIQHRGNRLGLHKTKETKDRLLAESNKKNGVKRRKLRKHKNGYKLVCIPEHPRAGKDGCVMEHRLVMEKYLGRFLETNEVVHHINGIKNDNRIENLELMLHGEHTVHHHVGLKRSKETRQKISQKAKLRLSDKKNHHFYKQISKEEFVDVINKSKSVKEVTNHFGICERTYYNKLNEFGIRRDVFSVKQSGVDW